jgi:DNA-binding CsgD family transcriptional regulator
MNLFKIIATTILILMISVNTHSQNSNKLSKKNEIDSLFTIFKSDPSGFKNHYRMLKKAKSIQYHDGILGSYLTLIYYNSNENTKDSMIYYCNKFELLEKEHPNTLKKIDFLSYKGQGLQNAWGLSEEAIKYYLEAYDLVEKINGDATTKTSIIRRIALFYNSKREHSRALKLLLEQIKDTSSLSYHVKRMYLLEIVKTYQNLKIATKSILFNDVLLKIVTKNKDNEWVLRCNVEALENNILEGNYKSAIDYGLVVHQKLLNNNDPNFKDIKINNDEYLALAYQAIGDYKKAIFYLKKAMSIEQMSDAHIYSYNQLADCYEADNNLKLAMNTYKEKNVHIDDMRVVEQKAFADYYENQINTINIREEAQNIKLKNAIIMTQNKRQQLYISLLLISLLTFGLFVALFIVGKKYKSTKNKVVTLKINELNILKNHIKVRENELSAILIAEAKKTEQLDQIKITFTEAIKNNDKEQMNIAQKSLNQYLKSAEEFGIFSDRLESQYPGIVKQLKDSHPELSQNDIRHSLLVKLGLSLKESAQLLNVTPGTVKNSRYRVTKKLDLPDDVNFKQYLDQIENNGFIVRP